MAAARHANHRKLRYRGRPLLALSLFTAFHMSCTCHDDYESNSLVVFVKICVYCYGIPAIQFVCKKRLLLRNPFCQHPIIPYSTVSQASITHISSLHYTPRKIMCNKKQCSTYNPVVRKPKKKSKIPLGIKNRSIWTTPSQPKKLPNHVINAGAPKERHKERAQSHE